MAVVKVIRLIGNSRRSWEEAASEALREAAKTVRSIQGVEATDFTAQVQDGRISEYRCTVNIAFKIEGAGGAGGDESGGGGRSGAGGRGGAGERGAAGGRGASGGREGGGAAGGRGGPGGRGGGQTGRGGGRGR